jgi:hypothetical protein
VAEPPCRVLASYLIDLIKYLSCVGNPGTANSILWHFNFEQHRRGVRDLHPHYITKTDDCDWLEILLLWTAHTPCGVNSLRKSNQIKSNSTVEWKGINKPAAVKAAAANGTYLIDGFTQYYGP